MSYPSAPPAGPGQAEGDWEGTAGSTDYYPGGGLCASSDGSTWFSMSIPNSYDDQFFETWVEPVPEPAITGLLTLVLLGLPFALRNRISKD